MRIGQGFDVHQLAENHSLIVGGVTIPFEKGLVGHSDADVLLHAITDAVLGAIGKGDIGTLFPDTDPSYQGADSAELLRQVWQEATRAGYYLINLDATLIAQKPKMAPYIPQIKKRIADILEVEIEQINVKATTTERLGFTGREEGIASMTVVLLDRDR